MINIKLKYLYSRLEKCEVSSIDKFPSLTFKDEVVIHVNEDELIDYLAHISNHPKRIENVDNAISEFFPYRLSANDKAVINTIDSVYLQYGDGYKKSYRPQINGGCGGLFIYQEKQTDLVCSINLLYDDVLCFRESLESEGNLESEIEYIIETFEDLYFAPQVRYPARKRGEKRTETSFPKANESIKTLLFVLDGKVHKILG